MSNPRAKKIKFDREALAQEQEAKKKQKNNPYRWWMYVIYLWAARMGVGAVGMLIATVFGALMDSKYIDYERPLRSTDWIQLVRTDYQDVDQIRKDMKPVVISRVPVIGKLPLQHLIKEILFTDPSSKIKVANNNSFVYLDNSRQWLNIASKINGYPASMSSIAKNSGCFPKHEILFESFLVKKLGNSHVSDSREMNCFYLYPDYADSSEAEKEQIKSSLTVESTHGPNPKSHYLYGTYHLPPNKLKKISSSLQHLVDSQAQTPQMNLWVGSENVSVSLHYDMEDNFLLQLYGNKRVTVYSPEIMELAVPYGSLHSLWRQTQHETSYLSSSLFHSVSSINNAVAEHLSTITESKDRTHRNSTRVSPKRQEQKSAPPSSSSSSSSSVTSSSNGNQNSPLVTDSIFIHPKYSLNKLNTSALSDLRIWQTTLRQGEMLYIPAGFFHTVHTGKDSLSLNLWLTSWLTEGHDILSTVNLPFDNNLDSLSHKLGTFGYMIRTVLFDPENVKLGIPYDDILLFQQLFLSRYEYARKYGFNVNKQITHDNGDMIENSKISYRCIITPTNNECNNSSEISISTHSDTEENSCQNKLEQNHESHDKSVCEDDDNSSNNNILLPTRVKDAAIELGAALRMIFLSSIDEDSNPALPLDNRRRLSSLEKKDAASKLKSRSMLLAQLFMDYIEEVLQLALGSGNCDPCTLINFVLEYCGSTNTSSDINLNTSPDGAIESTLPHRVSKIKINAPITDSS